MWDMELCSNGIHGLLYLHLLPSAIQLINQQVSQYLGQTLGFLDSRTLCKTSESDVLVLALASMATHFLVPLVLVQVGVSDQ